MIPFLKSVAKGYARRYGRGIATDDIHLSDICFVFPNKRAGTFFLKYLSEEVNGTFLAPEVTNITDFVTFLSQRQIATRLDMLMQLYKCYLQLMAPGVSQTELPDNLSFDSFRIWGDTVLKDFSDVDLHNVDADVIFKNLKDFRSIATDYLTDEQKEVVTEYFGKNLYESTESFWRSFDSFDDEEEEEDDDKKNPSTKKREARKKFIYLWQILSPLYELFDKALAEQGMATTGKAYRLAMQRLESGIENTLPWKKIVMIGFNALSGAERGIFKALSLLTSTDKHHSYPLTDFVWDATGPVLADKDNPAGRFVAINKKKYPHPEWLDEYLLESNIAGLPAHLEIISSPSNALQAKIAGEELTDMLHKLGEEAFNDVKVAVVLPDESLLMPMLYGIPTELGTANLTMGYPLKETSVATFMALLRGLQSTQRVGNAGVGYGINELNRFFAHPLAHAIIGTGEIAKFRAEMIRKRRLVVNAQDLSLLPERGQRLLRQISTKSTPEKAAQYLNDALELVAEAMESQKGSLVRNNLEYVHARTWQKALRHLMDVIHRYEINMKPVTLIYEAERLLSAETVPFEGEPLEGLQIMGLLETRLLDFDHVIILSMNDRIMPRRARQRTFIPDTLRKAYGLPPSNYQENIFSYYFYRLISRAKSVRMLYDSRIGLSGGGPSRYLHQLDILYAKQNIIHSERKMAVTRAVTQYESGLSNSTTLSILDRYKVGAEKSRRWSATTLKKYCICPLKFYLEVICGIKTDVKKSEILDAIDHGDIFHHLMEKIYLPEGYTKQKDLYDIPVTVTREKIEGYLSSPELLSRMVLEQINKDFYKLNDDELDTPLPPSTAIIANAIQLQLESTLRHDLTLTPFDILGCESGADLTYKVNDDLNLNVRFFIDRLDRVPVGTDEKGNNLYGVRIVDYKTGAVYTQKKSFDEFFEKMSSSDPSFQLMFYAEMLSRWDQWREKYGSQSPSLVVYEITARKLNHLNEVRVPMLADKEVSDYADVKEEFNQHLKAILEEIYRKDKVFEAVPEDHNCSFCDFRTICHR